ncbi:MAG: hypothetical protein ACRDN9_07700 [Streptosporangiaceae bacterium]
MSAEWKSDPSRPSLDDLSIYGSLLLRGAIAASSVGDRSTALELLGEATDAARHVGGDDNRRWTAFGPTNVCQHWVNASVALGDAGTAVEHARSIDVTRIPIAERQASLFIDVARAFVHWGKYDRACHALNAADWVTHEEVTARPIVHSLVNDLDLQAPRSVQPQVRALAERVGGQS